MCNCRNKQGFKQELNKAKKMTKDTGETHVVYHMPAVDLFFIAKESELNDEIGLCCYFLPDGTEKEYTPGQTVDKMDVVGAEEVGNDPISAKDYANFVDNGKVSKTTLKAIAEKVKAKEELSERENAIFVAKTSEIEELIKD